MVERWREDGEGGREGCRGKEEIGGDGAGEGGRGGLLRQGSEGNRRGGAKGRGWYMGERANQRAKEGER